MTDAPACCASRYDSGRAMIYRCNHRTRAHSRCQRVSVYLAQTLVNGREKDVRPRARGYVRSTCDVRRASPSFAAVGYPKFYLRSHPIPMLLTVPIFRRFPPAGGQGNLSLLRIASGVIDESVKKTRRIAEWSPHFLVVGSFGRQINVLEALFLVSSSGS